MKLEFKVTGDINPYDQLTFEGCTIHKTKEGENAHMIAWMAATVGDTITIDIQPIYVS